MAKRLLSAVVLIPPVLALVWFNPGGVAVFTLVALLLFGLTWEYGRLVNARGASFGGFEIVSVWLVSVWWSVPSRLSDLLSPSMDAESTVGLLFVLLVAASFARHVARRMTDGALIHSAAVVFGAVYLGWGFARHAVLLHERGGPQWWFVLLGAVWACDSGAYFVGRAVGRRALAPTVSPNKTWEGAVGGLAASVLVAYGLIRWLIPGAMSQAVVVGLLIGVVGQLSDLAESALKRDAGLKDSGGLIPGHGGLLDRLDSLLLTTPLLYYYLRLSATIS